MPFSTPIFKKETLDFIIQRYPSDSTILDIGAGSGTYAKLFDGRYPKIDAVEAFAPYIEEYGLRNLYNRVYNENITEFQFGYYDVIIFGDVLEHIEEEKGIELVENLQTHCRDLIICVPFMSDQGVHFDNELEIHLQNKLTNESFLEKYKGFRPLCLREDYGVYIMDTEENKDIPITYDEWWTGERVNEKPKEIVRPESKTTIVTGLWNIGRVGRDFDFYITHFKRLLEMDANMFIYVPKELESLVWEVRDKKNTYVKVFELDDIKTLMAPFYDKIQAIRTNPEWINQTGEGGWLKESPQCVNEWYNPIVMAKMPMLHSASCWNPFSSDKFIWIDAGITSTVWEKYLVEERALEKMEAHLDPFLFLSYPYITHTEIHGFPKKDMDRYAGADVRYVCRGGLFGGTKMAIDEANGMYYSTLMDTLTQGLMGTEESIFTIMAHQKSEIFRRYELDDNGLIVKYVQNLFSDPCQLVPVSVQHEKLARAYKNADKTRTDLYILTFNFPEQLTEILKSLEKAGWLEKAGSVTVIDNSDKPESIVENGVICIQYGAKHHPTGKNGGICGGRMIAAQLFDASEADYYIFFEDDMLFYTEEDNRPFCRNGFRTIIPDLFEKLQKIMQKEEFDFLKLSFTEVYMDNHIQVSWYNVPQVIRTEIWPEYDRLPIHGLDPNCPRTQFNTIDNYDGLCYITGDIYYANWPMIMSKEGNRKVFLETTWAYPFEQTWMSYVFQEQLKGKITGAILLASPIRHNRTSHYKPEERREN